MKHKLNKQKGFTLIELMVVIAIIALLSSVVLASLKGAREKAVLSKTVAEMKSLQNALELYRNQFGVYPGGPDIDNYDDANDNHDDAYNYFTSSGADTEPFFKQELIDKKFISKVPHAPNYPNNCGPSDCTTKGYVLGYAGYNTFTGDYYKNENSTQDGNATCGNEKIKNYVIYLFTPSNVVLKLPEYRILVIGLGYKTLDYWSVQSKVYCIAV